MYQTAISQRQTKYCRAIVTALEKLGHATNNELLLELRKAYPEVSPTTVHRATARLASRGDVALAPPTNDGAMRYDINTHPHDHFMCASCGTLRDTDIKNKVAPILESSLEGCSVSGRITVSGICKICKENQQ